LAAGECQQSLRHGPREIRTIHRFFDHLPQLDGLGRHEVVEIMCHTAGELPDGLHFQRLVQRALRCQAFALGGASTT
jgi:hypothetical protein